jgi:hypothetical protein
MSTRSLLPVWLACLGLAVSGCDVKVGEQGLSFGVTEGRATDEWTRTYTLPPDGRLEVANVNGAIEAFPAAGGQVEIVARREVRAGSDEDAQALLKEARMIEEVAPDRVKVEAPARIQGQSGPFGRRSIVVQFRVGIPAGLNVVLKTENGRVQVDNVKSRLTLSSTNGGVTVRGVSGPLEVQTVNGGLTVDVSALTDDISVGGVNGGIRIEVPRDVNADLEAHAVNGGVSIDDALTITATQQERQHIVGRINQGGPKISAQIVNGGVRISARASQ